MKLKLETRSPVHIGSGEELTSRCDYIYEDGRVHYIDHEKLRKQIKKREQSTSLIDDYVERVKIQDSSDSDTIGEFIKRNFGNFKEFCVRSIKAEGDIKTENINKHIRTGNRPFIPGSTLKGAIRTALFYKMLSRGQNTQNLDKVSEAGIFGKYGDDVLKYLSVSDTEVLEKNDLKVVQVKNYDIEEGNSQMPITLETIPAGIESSFKIDLKARKNYHRPLKNSLDFLYEGSEEKILKFVNRFTMDRLNDEIKALKQTDTGKLNYIIKLLKGLRRKVKQYKGNNEGAIMRIGRGKTFFDNTVTGILKGEKREEFIENKPLGSDDGDTFPVTRTYRMDNDRPSTMLGWVEINPL